VTRLNLGLVGCGRLAEQGYIPALATTPGLRLAAVADVDAARRARLAALGAPLAAAPCTRVATFDSASALLEGTRLDGLVVASPAGDHVATATLAAAAGVPCLVEKPPAPTVLGAQALADLRPRPWIGFNRRFDGHALCMKQAVPHRGELLVRLGITYRRAAWAAHEVNDDALLDLGPHVLDLARWLTGSEIQAVQARRLTREDARFELTMGRATVHIHVATNRPHREWIDVRTLHSRPIAHSTVGGLRRAVAARFRPDREPAALVASLRTQLLAFATAIAGGDAGQHAPSGLATAVDGVIAMAAVEAIRASHERGGAPVAVHHAGAAPC
jgi:predicted dehydrogenase